MLLVFTSLRVLVSLPSNTIKMGGGGGKPQNIFTLNRGDEPKEVINWKLWFAVFSFGIMGAARGVDEGLISGMSPFPILSSNI